MIVFQVEESLFHLLRTLIGEALQIDISYSIAANAIPRYLVDLHLFADNIDLTGFLLARPLDSQCHFRIRNTLQQFAHLFVFEQTHVGCVDRQDFITRFQSCLSGRHPLERLDDHDMPSFVSLADIGTNATIFAGDHLLEITHFLLRKIFRIRIKPTKHGIYTSADGLVHIYRIHIEHLHLLYHGVEDLEVFTYFKMIILFLLRFGRRDESGKKQKAKSKHCLFMHHIFSFIYIKCKSIHFLKPLPFSVSFLTNFVLHERKQAIVHSFTIFISPAHEIIFYHSGRN